MIPYCPPPVVGHNNSSEENSTNTLSTQTTSNYTSSNQHQTTDYDTHMAIGYAVFLIVIVILTWVIADWFDKHKK